MKTKKSKPVRKTAKQIKRMKAEERRKVVSPPSSENRAFQPITKDMSFGEVLQRFPQTAPVFAKYGMHCIGCSMSAFETIEQGAMAHGTNVKKFVDDLNTAASSK